MNPKYQFRIFVLSNIFYNKIPKQNLAYNPPKIDVFITSFSVLGSKSFLSGVQKSSPSIQSAPKLEPKPVLLQKEQDQENEEPNNVEVQTAKVDQ